LLVAVVVFTLLVVSDFYRTHGRLSWRDGPIATAKQLDQERYLGAATSISMTESEGFFDEPDDTWARRKQVHMRQMSLQAELMGKCNRLIRFRECICGITAMNRCTGHRFWQGHYEPSFSCNFRERIGMPGDGGKWVCDPYKIESQKACLVYSIGSNGQYDFEESVHQRISSKCEIHTVDMKPWRAYTKTPPPEYVSYHVRKIGLAPDTNVSTLVQELGHTNRAIDIFKIDCERCEWATFKSWFGEGVYIRQVLVELHGTGGWQETGGLPAKTIGAHNFFNYLFDLGYVVFNKEPNTLGCGGNCIEYSFVKLSPLFSRAQSGN
jgi:hypothetical protein